MSLEGITKQRPVDWDIDTDMSLKVAVSWGLSEWSIYYNGKYIGEVQRSFKGGLWTGYCANSCRCNLSYLGTDRFLDDLLLIMKNHHLKLQKEITNE